MSTSTDMRTALSLSEECIVLFDKFYSHQPQWTEDQLARFEIWIANLGVFEIGHASIDYRLRDHPDVYSLITKQTEVLKINLEALNSSLVESAQPSIKGKGTRTSQFFKIDGEDFVYDSPPSEASSSSSESASIPQGRRKQSSGLQVVEDTIARLNALSVAIRRAGKQSRATKADVYEFLDDTGLEIINRTKEFQMIASAIVKRDIPDAASFLQDRLIVSVARRRNRLLYWRRHQMPSMYLSKRVSLGHVQERMAIRQANSSQTVNHDKKNQRSTKNARTIKTGLTATTFNENEFKKPSASARGSIRTTGSVHWKAREEFPKPPKIEVKESYFVCPICLINSPVKEAHGDQWVQHVTRDLKPYICILDGCKTPQTVFETFQEWMEHIKEEQMTSEWFCSSNTHIPLRFNSSGLFESHIRQQHAGGFIEGQFPALSKRNKRLASDVFVSCPFCAYSLDEESLAQDRSVKDQEQLQYHISRHLLSLAFISLPPLSIGGSLKSESGDSSKVALDSRVGKSETMETLTFDDEVPDPDLMDNSIEEATDIWDWWDWHETLSREPDPYDDSTNLQDPILRHLSDAQQNLFREKKISAEDTSGAQEPVSGANIVETLSESTQEADLTEDSGYFDQRQIINNPDDQNEQTEEYAIAEHSPGFSAQETKKAISRDQNDAQSSPEHYRNITGTPGNMKSLDARSVITNTDWNRFFLAGEEMKRESELREESKSELSRESASAWEREMEEMEYRRFEMEREKELREEKKSELDRERASSWEREMELEGKRRELARERKLKEDRKKELEREWRLTEEKKSNLAIKKR